MEENIDDILENWYNAKNQITKLENDIILYKKKCDLIMDKKNIDVIVNKTYVLKKKEMNRTTISKKDLPIDIFNRYSKESFCNAFYITKINEKRSTSKIKRSRKKDI